MTTKLCATVTNTNATPHVRITVVHVGKNDYMVSLPGIGSHSTHTQFGLAITKARWLAALQADDIKHEIAKVKSWREFLVDGKEQRT